MLKNGKILKLTVNTGQVMFSREIYYYWPQFQLAKSLVKHRFPLCSRNISMAEKLIVCFQSKQVKYVGFLYFSQLLYIFEEIFWNICN